MSRKSGQSITAAASCAPPSLAPLPRQPASTTQATSARLPAEVIARHSRRQRRELLVGVGGRPHVDDARAGVVVVLRRGGPLPLLLARFEAAAAGAVAPVSVGAVHLRRGKAVRVAQLVDVGRLAGAVVQVDAPAPHRAAGADRAVGAVVVAVAVAHAGAVAAVHALLIGADAAVHVGGVAVRRVRLVLGRARGRAGRAVAYALVRALAGRGRRLRARLPLERVPRGRRADGTGAEQPGEA